VFEDCLGVGAREGAPRRRRRPVPTRRRGAHRVARRSAVVLVLLCLVGGVALAAQLGSGGSKKARTSPATVAENGAAGWRLSGYRDRGRLCLLFTVANELSNECAGPPRSDGLRFGAAVDEGRRYLAGFTGSQVRTVAVTVGDNLASASTHLAERKTAQEAGLPDRLRWFVVPLELGPGSLRLPARVRALDDHGRQLGPAHLDCSLGVIGPDCLQQIRTRAAEAAN